MAGLLCAPRGPPLPWFRDATKASGIDFEFVPVDFRGGPIAVADTDGDGLLDVMAGSRAGGLAHFRNLGGWSFADDTGAAGLAEDGPVHFIAPADLDNDGDRDMVVAGDRIILFENRGGGRFARAADLGDGSATEHILPVDLDADGLLELYVSNRDRRDPERSRNRLLASRGGLLFDDVPGAAGADTAGLSWTASALDADRDGDLDLYVANDTLVADHGQPRPSGVALPPDAFFRNDTAAPGQFRLVDRAAALGLDRPRSSMDGLVADIDGDQRLDLFVTDFGRKKLFTGTREGGFAERGEELGVSATTRWDGTCALTSNQASQACLLLSWGSQRADLDLDGHDDLVVLNGVSVTDGLPAPAVVLRGPPPFQEIDAGLGCFEGHGVIAADLDDDGDADLVASTRSGPLRLFQNGAAPGGAALRIALQGRRSNRDGLGAVVGVRTAGGQRLVAEIGAGGVVHSSPPAVAEISLGEDRAIAVDVSWPSGAQQELEAPAGSRVLVLEPDPPR